MSAKETGIGLDHATALALVGMVEKGRMIARYRIEKYVGDFKQASDIPVDVKPFAILEFAHNCLLNEGINELWTILCSVASGTKFDATHAYLGVGDSATGAVATQEGLQGAENAGTHKLYKAMDSPYPIYGTDQKVTFRSTFGSPDANFAWNEITVANGDGDDHINLNRKVQAMGTKAAATTWVATLEITLA